MAHVVGEWTSILEDPNYDPSIVVPPRRRVRPKPQTTPNGNSKLTVAAVRAIRKDARPFDKIAKELGVDPSTIARVKSGATWAWVI